MIDSKAFAESVLNIVAQIPAGSVLTYKRIAVLTGYPNHSRLVGRILNHDPRATALPCQRVVNSQGRTAPCWLEQKELLLAEGVTFCSNDKVDLGKHLWQLPDAQTF